MPSPKTTRGLLGLFSRGADPPANDPRATTLLVLLLTYSSIQEISAARAGVWSARGGASSRRVPQEEGRTRKGGEAEIKVWNGRSDEASEAETEEEGWGHDTLTASP